MRNFFLPVSVFVAGASILALEILGTRILGPFYGVSLYLWSALIATTLIALSVGYCLGGWMADRRATYARLSALLLGAGLWVLIVPWIRGPVLTVGESLGLRTAVFVTAVLLFFPPLTLLAMMSPLAVRLRATTLTVVGRSAGNLSAISTVAGVVSALATGFFFIPALGVTALTLLIGALLIATGLVGVITNREASRTTVVAAIVGALVVLALAVLSMRPAGGSALAEV